MNEPQVWTVIGVLGSSLLGVLTLMSTMFVRIIRTEVGSVRNEIGSLRSEMQAEFASVRTDITYLDRDVQALTRHVFGDGAA